MKKQSDNSFSWSQVSAFRLRRHHLVERSRQNLSRVSQDVCGIQAQVMAAAQMALWARLHELTRADIESALWQRREMVKTSGMRGTLHLLPAAKFSLYINALKRSRLGERRIMSKFGITPGEAEGMTQAVMAALEAGPLTKRELHQQVKAKVGKNLRRWMELVWNAFKPALAEGLICYGPERGPEATFVRVDQWLPGQKEVPESKAKEVLARCYLKAYGPASPRDFSSWAGFSSKEGRAVWTLLEEELAEVWVEGKAAWILREDVGPLRNSQPGDETVRLLPGFDPYLLGHAEKTHLVDATHYKRVYRQAGWISPVVLREGRVIGTWSYTRGGKRLSLEVAPFQRFSKSIRTQVEEQAASLGRFLETAWELKFRE